MVHLGLDHVQKAAGGSKFCFLNVVFSDDFLDDGVKMNDKKYEDELDAGKVGNNQHPWSSDRVCVVGAHFVTIRLALNSTF